MIRDYKDSIIMRQISNLHTMWILVVLWGLAISVFSQCPNGTTGYNCAACPDKCDVCDTDPNYCDNCTKGNYLDDNQTCQSCPSYCLNCSTPYQCDECTPGYDTAYNDSQYQQCVFYWWKWFLIIFGTLLGFALLVLLIYFIRKKLKDQDTNNKQIEYEMKVQTTQPNIS